MDPFLYYDALDESKLDVPFLRKEVLKVNDQNNGNYSGKIIIDTTTLVNKQMWMSPKEAYLKIPFVISMVSNVDLTTIGNSFMAGLKSGHHQIIDSLTVKYGQHLVVESRNHLNQFINYNVLTSWSSKDLDKWGDSIGLNPDSPFVKYDAAGLVVDDYYNNRAVDPDRTVKDWLSEPVRQNDGFYERLKNVRPATGLGGMTYADPSIVGSSYYSTSGAGVDRVYYWVIQATIRLKDLHSFFQEMSLYRGNNLRIEITYNKGSLNLAGLKDTGAGPPNYNAELGSIASPIINSGNTVPIMVSSCESSANASNPFYLPNALTGDPNISVYYNAVKTSQISPETGLGSAVLYLPAYDLDPEYQSALLQTPEKVIKYKDIYQYTISATGIGASVDQILTDGLKNMKYLVIIPNVSSTEATLDTFTPNLRQSPFVSEGSTTATLATIERFNVRINGKNVFQQDLDYNFEHFVDEFTKINCPKSNIDGISTGLINQKQWELSYKYYVVDLSRQTDDVTPMSLSVKLTNTSGRDMDYLCYVVLEKKITLDLNNGRVLDIAL